MVFVNNQLFDRLFSIKKRKKLREDIPQEVYDPRIREVVYSDNPALIIADITLKSNNETADDFWQKIKILADYCDQRI